MVERGNPPLPHPGWEVGGGGAPRTWSQGGCRPEASRGGRQFGAGKGRAERSFLEERRKLCPFLEVGEVAPGRAVEVNPEELSPQAEVSKGTGCNPGYRPSLKPGTHTQALEAQQCPLAPSLAGRGGLGAGRWKVCDATTLDSLGSV